MSQMYKIVLAFIISVQVNISYCQDSIIENILLAVFQHESQDFFTLESQDLGWFHIVNVMRSELRTYNDVDSLWLNHFVTRGMRKLKLVTQPNESFRFLYGAIGGFYKSSNKPTYYVMPNSTFSDTLTTIKMKVFYDLNSNDSIGKINCYKYELTRKTIFQKWTVALILHENRTLDLSVKRSILLSELLINDW